MIDKLLENTPVFMSPVNEQSESVEITVYNNSDDLLEAVGIASEFENCAFKNMRLTPIELKKQEITKLNYNKSNNVKFMIWDSFDGLRPLLPTTEYKNGGNSK